MKTHILREDRIAKTAHLRLGCAAAIFDETGQKLLLTQRADNTQWCLSSGGMDPGESVSETAVREVFEETGLSVEVTALIGVYSSPHMIMVYPDSNRVQVVSLTFACKILEGTPSLSDETLDVGFYTREEIRSLDGIENHTLRLRDTFEFKGEPFIR